MNNHTIEGLRAQRDALLAELKASHETDMENEAQFFNRDDFREMHKENWPECETCALIATIEALPKEAPELVGKAEQLPGGVPVESQSERD